MFGDYFQEIHYLYIHGATLLSTNPIRNKRVSPARIFVIRPFAPLTSPQVAPDIEYSIPEYTSINAPTSAVMNVAYLMSPLKISMTLPNPDSTVHLYFCFVMSPTLVQTQSMPGIFSVTVTVVGDPSVVFEGVSAVVGTGGPT